MNLLNGILTTTTILSSLTNIKVANDVTYNKQKYAENLALIKNTNLSNIDIDYINGKLKVEIFNYMNDNYKNEENFNSLKNYLYKNDSNFKSGARSIKKNLSFEYNENLSSSALTNYKMEKTNENINFNGIKIIKNYSGCDFYGFYFDEESCLYIENMLCDIALNVYELYKLIPQINIALNLTIAGFISSIYAQLAAIAFKIISVIADIFVKVACIIISVLAISAIIVFSLIVYCSVRDSGLLIGFKRTNSIWIPYIEAL